MPEEAKKTLEGAEKAEEYYPDEKVVYKWKALERPFKQRGSDFYSTIVVLALLISVIMFFIDGWQTALLVWAVVFMIWAIYKTPPMTTEHEITTRGIRTDGRLYPWGTMVFYWMEERWGCKLFRSALRQAPGQLILVLTEKAEEMIEKAIRGQVQKEKPKPNWIDKTVAWFGKRIPLD